MIKSRCLHFARPEAKVLVKSTRGILSPATLLLALTLLFPVVSQAQLTYSGDLATTKAFMADLVALYKLRGKGEISIELSPSSEAIKRAATGEIDLGGSARAPRTDDRQERRVAVYPVVWDALVVIVNRETPITNISLRQLYEVYTGQITNWNNIGGGDHPIDLFTHRDPMEGIEHSFKELLMGNANLTIAASKNFGNTQLLEEAVEATPWSFAVTTYSSASKLKVRILSLDDSSPSAQSIQNGDYLLYFPLYLALREDGRNRREVREFLRFTSSVDAKRVLRRNGLLPYTDGLSLGSRQLQRSTLLERLRADAQSP
jgi:phosphate transport system substrate-binding protein